MDCLSTIPVVRVLVHFRCFRWTIGEPTNFESHHSVQTFVSAPGLELDAICSNAASNAFKGRRWNLSPGRKAMVSKNGSIEIVADTILLQFLQHFQVDFQRGVESLSLSVNTH